MSIQVYSSDNLNIIAGRWEQINSIPTIEEEKENKVDKTGTLRLHIQILVNWKIKNIFQQYEVIKEQWTIVGSPNIFKLKEYYSFNALCDILSHLWYDTIWFYWKLESTIEKLFQD